MAAAPSLLQEVAGERLKKRRRRFARYFGDTLRLLEVLERRPPTRGYRSIAELERAHDRLSREALSSGKLLEGRNGPFPDPQLPGESWIQPITTPSELLLEAAEQANCLAGYLEEAKRGLQSFFRILEPQRATLALRPGYEGWEIVELRTAGNGEASEATWNAVRAWLQGKPLPEGTPPPDSWDDVPWSEGVECAAEESID